MDNLIAQEQGTAKNGLTFTGTAVTSGANNRGHTHTLNNGNTSSSGTITTAGFRGVANTTSQTVTDASGSTTAKSLIGEWGTVKQGSSIWSVLNREEGYPTGIFSKGTDCYYASTGRPSDPGSMVKIDATHQHRFTPGGYLYGKTDGESQNHTHSVTASGTISGDAETRPINYTIRVWKRVS